MRLTPLDIRGQQFRRVMRGLDAEEVEAFLSAVADEFESVVGENKELRHRVLDLEEKVAEYRNMEKALRDTLLTAEKVMGDAKEGAQREATLIIREAELSAQRATARLSQEMADLRRDLVELRRLKDAYLTRVRWLLRSHLDLIEGHAQEFAEIDSSLVRPQFDGAGLVAGPGPAAGGGGGVPPAPRSTGAGGAAAPLPPPAETWRRLEPAPDGGLPPGDDLADVLRPVAPDGSYGTGAPQPGPPHAPSAQELVEAARRAERLAAEARAAAERRGSQAQVPPAGDEPWSMERFREGLTGEEPLP